jgi:tubulin--tyrosine ligase
VCAQVYLIEINTSPALFRAGAYLSDLLPRVIEEVVQKCVDPFYPPPPGTPASSLPVPLDGFEQVDLVQFPAAAGGAAALLRKSSSLGSRARDVSPEKGALGGARAAGRTAVQRQGSVGAARKTSITGDARTPQQPVAVIGLQKQTSIGREQAAWK